MPSLRITISLAISAFSLLVAASPIEKRQASSWTFSYFNQATSCQGPAEEVQTNTGSIGCTPISDLAKYDNYGLAGSFSLTLNGDGGALTARLYTDSACTMEFDGVTQTDASPDCYNVHGGGPTYYEVDQAGA